MENPRPEKVAVVEEVRDRLDGSSAALLTEYRGLDVGSISELRRALRAAGGDYKVYKNTLVRFAARDLGLEIEDMLTGPTAIAFVTERPDGSPGDAVDVAKALKDFAKTNPALVVKGGLLGDQAAQTPRRRRRWPTSSPARCCWPGWPAAWRRRCSRWPACSPRCPATSPTA
jgi:large subunit ribosomal protein L10